jgi:hypothetical protein
MHVETGYDDKLKNKDDSLMPVFKLFLARISYLVIEFHTSVF